MRAPLNVLDAAHCCGALVRVRTTSVQRYVYVVRTVRTPRGLVAVYVEPHRLPRDLRLGELVGLRGTVVRYRGAPRRVAHRVRRRLAACRACRQLAARRGAP